MERISRSNRIINEIMANASPAAIIMSKSDGENIGFLSELSNFYKHTFWLNADYDNIYSFPAEFARKVFADDEDSYNKIIQFKHCEFDFNKDNIIINEVLKKIASMNGDCLIIIDNLELLSDNFKYNLLELLLKNCPRNLKVVMVSENFININYNIFSEHCPKLLDYHTINWETASLSGLYGESLSFTQRAFLCYVSVCRHIDKEFAISIYPEAIELLDYLNKKHRYAVFSKGEELYYFHEGLHDYLLKKEPELCESDFFKSDIEQLLCEHYISKNKPVKALELALKGLKVELVDRIVAQFIHDGKYMFMLEEYVEEVCEDIVLKDFGVECLGVNYLAALCNLYLKDYKTAIAIAENLILAAPKNSHLEFDAYALKFRCYIGMGNFKNAVEYARDILDERVINADKNNIYLMENILCRLPYAMKNSDSQVGAVNFKFCESMLMGEENKNKYWYAKALQSVAEVYFDWGNYGKAINHINEIKSILPFYVIPYKLMDFYYYIGDMKFAAEVAEKALEDAMMHNIDADLADVYTLLAKISMYFNKQKEALSYIGSAVKCRNTREAGKYFAITIRSIICAKTGRAEYGRDIAMIYAKYCELNSVKIGFYLYGAIAFCCWKLGDKEQALYYARKCVAKASARSGVWLLASALSVSILLESDELRDAKAIVEKILNSSANYGMITVVVDYYDCFENIIKYAKENHIRLEYVAEVEKRLANKMCSVAPENSVSVKFMGVSSVTVGGEELQWKTRKAKELFLMYIWLGERGLDRNFILSTLWPDYVYVSAINNLKTTNNIIRNTLNAAKVEFKLDYGNSKYTLNIPNLQSDYSLFMEKLTEYEETTPTGARLSSLKEVLALYNSGFTTEINHPYFRKHADNLKERIMLAVVNMAKVLVNEGDYIEAKRLINHAGNVDRDGEYSFLTADLVKTLSEYYERN